MRSYLLLGLAVLLTPVLASAQISYTTTGATVTENFDSLNSANGGTDLAWTNNSTLPGWSLFRQPVPGTAIPTYRSGSGGSNAGSFYSFGVLGVNANEDRAFGGAASGGAYFGSPPSGTVAGWLAVSFTNNTGENLSSLTMQYTGEQWRNGGNAAAQTMVVEYGIGATFDTVTTWTAAGAGFNFTSPTVGTSAAALDGNAAANRLTNIGGSISAPWNTGEVLWFRFIENNDTGNDHGLALDDFSFSATAAAVPEPTTYALIGMTVLGAGVWYRRRNKGVNDRFARA